MTDATKTPTPGSPKSAGELLDMYYLHLRSALLETAAGFDRIQRAPGGDAAMRDPRMTKLKEACGLLADGQPERAERFQHLLSEDE